MLEELAPRCHLSALVKRPKRKFSSSPPPSGFQGCLDSRPGCIEKLDVRTPPPFYPLPRLSHGPNFFPPALAQGGQDTKNGAGALS